MEAVTISSKFQVVSPREVRDQFNLRPGQKIMFIPYNNVLHVVIVPPILVGQRVIHHPIRDMEGCRIAIR